MQAIAWSSWRRPPQGLVAMRERVAAAAALLPPLARQGRAVGLVMLAPVFMLPAVGSGADLARLLAGAAALLALHAGCLALAAGWRPAGAGAALAGLAGAALLGHGPLVMALLYGALTVVRLALPGRGGGLAVEGGRARTGPASRLLAPACVALGGLALLVVMDAAFTLLWLERSPAFLLFGFLLGLFLAAGEGHRTGRPGFGQLRQGLAALLLGSYVALLAAEPQLSFHFSAPLAASVPLLAVVLLRACRPSTPAPERPDGFMVAALATWALLMTVTLEGLPGA